MTRRRPLLVLEDDPTGTQLSGGVPFVLDCSADTVLRAGKATGAPAIHLLTNSRAYDRRGAERVVQRWARAGLEAFPGAAVMLRGDSTLRGWPLEEVQGLRRALRSRKSPLLLLVPAFPAAGRVTLGGRHYLHRDQTLVAVSETDYAADPVFGFRSSALLEWAGERSGGYFDPRAGTEIGLDELRAGGDERVVSARRALAAAGRPAVCAPDVETDGDIALVTNAWFRALREGLPVIARGSPAVATIAGGSAAPGPVDPGRPRGPVLVVVGSHVGLATEQLRHLLAAGPHETLELEVEPLLAGRARHAAAIAAAVSERLERDGVAIVATPRRVQAAHRDIRVAATLARRIARVVRSVEPRPRTVVTKGGITSAVIAREGFDAAWATVLGPIVPGVALWRLEGGGDGVEQAVAPGNIGGTDLLTRVVERMSAAATLV